MNHPSIKQRLYARVDMSGGLFACWPWTGARNPRGYGKLGIGRSPRGTKATVDVHRLSLEIALGRPLRAGMFALHVCDNPPCVNPLHLREGSARENTADMHAKGRHPHPCRISEADLAQMRRLAQEGMSQREIGQRFGVSQSAVSLYLLGKVVPSAGRAKAITLVADSLGDRFAPAWGAMVSAAAGA